MFYIYGELQWAAFGPSEVEEAALQGYQVSLTDHCGHDLLLLHSLPVDPLKAKGDDDSCCDAANWYMLRIGYTAIPQDTVALAISSWEGNFQKLVPLFQESYTTTTTTTFTVTSTTSMTSSITRVSTTSSTSLSSTSSTTQEPILEILEGCLSVSTVSADVFTSNPLEARQAVQQALADATRVELAMVEVTSLSLGGCGAAGGRRLQEELSFDYVIRFPPSSPNAGGAGQSLAEATAQQLAEMPVNEVTTLVRQRMAEQPIFKDVEVEVLSVDAKVIEVSLSTSAPSQQEEPISSGDAGEMVALVAAPIALLLFCIPAAWFAWRRWRRRRATQVTKVYLPSVEEEEPKKGRDRPKVDFASPAGSDAGASDGDHDERPPDTVLNMPQAVPPVVHARGKELDFHQHARGLRDAQLERYEVATTVQRFDHEFLDWTDQFCSWAQTSISSHGSASPPAMPKSAARDHGQILRGIGVSSEGPPPLPPLPSKLPSKVEQQALEIEEYHSPTAQVCDHCGKPESQCRQRIIEGYLYNPFYEGPHSRPPQERRRSLPRALPQVPAASSSRTPVRRRYEPL